jgi:hypothetical protein
MTSPHLRRSSGLLARSALLTLVLAGCATAGAATQSSTSATAASERVAVLAGPDAAPSAIAAATTRPDAIVSRTAGPLETQAQATRLAAEGYDTVIGVGAQARAAVAQAAAGEVGAGTRWRSSSR